MRDLITIREFGVDLHIYYTFYLQFQERNAQKTEYCTIVVTCTCISVDVEVLRNNIITNGAVFEEETDFHFIYIYTYRTNSVFIISFYINRGLQPEQEVLLTHGDSIDRVASNFKVIAKSGDIIAGMCVVVNFLSLVIICFSFVFWYVMYGNEVETKGK